jgi:acetyl esterase/lipase
VWRALPQGEVVASPSGSRAVTSIAFYPDSGKVGVFAYDRYDLYRRKGAVDYIETDAGGLPAPWAIPKGCSEDRVVLCMHGGGFVESSRWSASAATSLMALGSAAR